MNGDLAGKVQRVQRELQQLKFAGPLDDVGLRLGDPVALLPVLHFVLLRFSRHVAQTIHKAGFELQGKTDQKFVENAFRLFRDCFAIKTVLTPAHFLDQGFAERKLLLLSDVIQACKKIHNDEIRKERLAALKSKPGSGVENRLYEPARKTPEVKVVKGGQELRQVVQAQHLPNATDAGQAVFRVKKQLASSPAASQGTVGSQHSKGARSTQRDTPSPAPSINFQGAGSAAETPMFPGRSRPPLPPSAREQLAEGGAAGLDLTLNPKPNLAALSTPIHSWFVNPTFKDTSPQPDNVLGAQQNSTQQQLQQEAGPSGLGDETGVDAGASGRPWWDLGASGGLGSGLGFSFGMSGAGESGAAAWGDATVSFGQNAGGGKSSLLGQGLGQQQRAYGGLGGAGDSSSSDDDDDWGASKGLSIPQGLALGSGDEGGVQVVDVEPPTYEVDASTEPEGGMDLLGPPVTMPGPAGSAAAAGAGSYGLGVGVGALPHLAQTLVPQQPLRGHIHQQQFAQAQQQSYMQQVPAQAPAPAVPAMHLVQGPAVDQLRQEQRQQVEALDQRVWAVEKQLLGQVKELRERLEEAEAKAAEARADHARTSEALQARVTVLEGRVRFLECELESCVRRGEYSPPKPAAAASAAVGAGSGGTSSSPGQRQTGSPGRLGSPGAYRTAAKGQQEHPQPAASSVAAGLLGPKSSFAYEQGLGAQHASGNWGLQNPLAAQAAPGDGSTSNCSYASGHTGYVGAPAGMRMSQGVPGPQAQAAPPPTAAQHYQRPLAGFSAQGRPAAWAEAPQPTFSFQPGGQAMVSDMAQQMHMQREHALQPQQQQAPTATPASQPPLSLHQQLAATQEALVRSGAVSSSVTMGSSGSAGAAAGTSDMGQAKSGEGQHGHTGAGTSHEPSHAQQEAKPQYLTSSQAWDSHHAAPSYQATKPYQQQPSASQPAAASKAGAVGPGYAGSTSDLISSLFARYTEAQSFLADLRSSKQA